MRSPRLPNINVEWIDLARPYSRSLCHQVRIISPSNGWTANIMVPTPDCFSANTFASFPCIDRLGGAFLDSDFTEMSLPFAPETRLGKITMRPPAWIRTIEWSDD